MGATQPAGLHSATAVEVTIGVVSKFDRTAIVFPFAYDQVDLDRSNLCEGARLTVESVVVPALQACMSVDAHVSFISVDGMMDGMIPSRSDYTPATYPGSRTGTTIANNVAALINFYADPADIAAGTVMRVAKNFIPGISNSDVVNDLVVNALAAFLDTLAMLVQEGITDGGGGAGKWWRVLAKASQTSFSELLKRTITNGHRRYVGTQRRRLIPHG